LAVKLYNDPDYTVSKVCQIVGVSKTTLYKYLSNVS